MKLCLFPILMLFSCLTLTAQTADSTIQYIWKNEETNLTAAVEIYGLQRSKTACPVYFLSKVDTVFNSSSDSLFHAFSKDFLLSGPVVKISFYYFGDTTFGKKIKQYSDAFTKSILPDIRKKYAQLSVDNLIVAGINDFSLVVLLSAANYPLKINKTALLFNGDIENSSMKTEFAEASKKLKGKLFMYVTHQNFIDGFTDSFAKSLALASSVVLYKYDQYDKPLSENFFKEVYKWLMADGNNYIITNGD